MLIPLSALLSKVVLKRTFTKGQIGAIAVVICGLAVKAKDVADEAARRGTAIDARGILIANAATVSYGFRGLVMEYLSASKSSLSGNAQTMLMGTCGLAAFAIYTLARTARDMDGMVWAYYDASPRDVSSDFKGAPRKHAQSGVHGEDDDGQSSPERAPRSWRSRTRFAASASSRFRTSYFARTTRDSV